MESKSSWSELCRYIVSKLFNERKPGKWVPSYLHKCVVLDLHRVPPDLSVSDAECISSVWSFRERRFMLLSSHSNHMILL